MKSSFHIESLEEDEIEFLQKKYNKESKAYLFAMNRLLIIGAIIPLFIALYYFVNTGDKMILFKVYFIGLAFFILFISVIALLSYINNLWPLKKDLKYQEKIIEHVVIESAIHIDVSGSNHFYINSEFKLSIEVNDLFFASHKPGDEINIEYSKHAREYFGYF